MVGFMEKQGNIDTEQLGSISRPFHRASSANTIDELDSRILEMEGTSKLV